MKKIGLLLLITILFTEGYSQKKIRTTITPQHVRLNDSKIFIIPPPGFEKRLIGNDYANNETGAWIGAIQSEKSISTIVADLSKNYFIKKGYKITEIKELKFNKMMAWWYELETTFVDRTTVKYILVIGTNNEYAMMEALCPIEFPLANIALRRSLFTAYYDLDSTNIKKYQQIKSAH